MITILTKQEFRLLILTLDLRLENLQIEKQIDEKADKRNTRYRTYLQQKIDTIMRIRNKIEVLYDAGY